MYQALIRTLGWLLLAAAFAAPAAADSQEILIDDAWARATVGANRPGAVYLNLRNTGGGPVTLTGIRTEIAERAEVHVSATDANGVTTMQPADDIVIPGGRELALEPGGLHIMLMGLSKPLVKGGRIRLELVFDDGGTLLVFANIRSISATGPRS